MLEIPAEKTVFSSYAGFHSIRKLRWTRHRFVQRASRHVVEIGLDALQGIGYFVGEVVDEMAIRFIGGG
jgi:hypothetical protein